MLQQKPYLSWADPGFCRLFGECPKPGDPAMRNLFFRLFLACLLFPAAGWAQDILPTPMSVRRTAASFTFPEALEIASDPAFGPSADYLTARLEKYLPIKRGRAPSADIVFSRSPEGDSLGREGYTLEIGANRILIRSEADEGIFYGIQSLLQLLPEAVQAGKPFDLAGFSIPGMEVVDKPKYAWRSFMLDSGRQYQSPAFIKRYLDLLAMLKMNVFHWHLTEGQGWRVEIRKYPRLAEEGSRVAGGPEQQGYYSQEAIRDIVAYAQRLHIEVVPEIDVPGHSEAALTAYPEMTCFGEAPESVMTFSPALFCAGREETYRFLEGVLEEVCALFPSAYIHLGGDEAPKAHWDQCPDCQRRIREEGLTGAHDLQLYFSARLARFLQTKGKKVLFWGDVVYHEGRPLPDNVIVDWWNWRGHQDTAMKNAIAQGKAVICNTNYYTYLNFPVTPWSRYFEDRTFDLRDIYLKNPSDLPDPDPLVLGMGCSLWTDWHVLEHMIDRRVFPRVYALSEQMWHQGERSSFEAFLKKVEGKFPLLESLGVEYGPALKENTPEDYVWD